MVELLISAFCTSILSASLFLSKESFFNMAKSTLNLLNHMVGSYEDDRIQEKLIREGVLRLISNLFLFTTIIGLAAIFSWISLVGLI